MSERLDLTPRQLLETIKSIDQSIFLFLNGLHCSFLDPLFYWGTRPQTWIPLFLLMVFLVIKKYRWQALWIMLFAALMILVSDQLSNLFKMVVARPRPSHEPGLSDVHTVMGYMGGDYGFYSAHASTNLAIAVYLIIILGRPFRFFPLVMLSWAFVMAYSRIYLGVHYPGDIIAGWLAGSLIGWAFAQLAGWVTRKPLS